MSWKQWLNSLEPQMTAREVGLDNIPPWIMGVVSGFSRFHRPDSKSGLSESFFSIVGRWVNNGRFEWGQALLRPIGEPGIIVLFEVIEEGEEPLYLVTAQEAPGYVGTFFVGASLQTSSSRIAGHGVQPDTPSRMDLVKQGFARVMGRSIMDPRRIDDGENEMRVIPINRAQLGELAETERLVTRAELLEILQAGVAEVHLHSVAALLI